MSTTSTLVTAEHFAYLAARTRPEPPDLARLRQAAADAGLPRIHIAWEQASFMQILLQLSGAKAVLEVGTLGGYSALAMARALPAGGVVHTVEHAPKHATFARAFLAGSEGGDRVTVHVGAGADVLPLFPDGSFDAMFLDADKGGYPLYLQHALRLLRKGGLFMADNAFAFGQLLDAKPTDREVGAVRAFNDLMAKEQGIHAVIVPLGDGCWVGVKT